jgi:hypothetical protein
MLLSVIDAGIVTRCGERGAGQPISKTASQRQGLQRLVPDHRPRPGVPSGTSGSGFDAVSVWRRQALAGRAKRKSVSLTHIACNTTPSLRASATLARLAPAPACDVHRPGLERRPGGNASHDHMCGLEQRHPRTKASPARLMAPSRSV